VLNAPWTMAGFVPLTVETTVYATSIVRTLGEEATVATIVTDDDDGTAYLAALVAAVTDTELTIVAQQSVAPDVIEAPTTQVLTITTTRPDAIVADLSGPACATFLTELGKARAATPGWTPVVYVSSKCSDPSVLALAGQAADGVLSSSNLTTDNPTFLAAMTTAGVSFGLGLAAEGWTAAEVTVAIITQAKASPDGLTRASIMNAARNLSYTPMLARPGVHYTTNGVDDPNIAESLQVVRFDSATSSFVDVGALVAQFES